MGLEDSIIGVYLIDGPYWKNSSAKKPLTNAAVLKNLQEAAGLVKQYFPEVAVMLTEAAPVIGAGNIRFPANVDWIGPNCYLYNDECKTIPELENLYHKLAQNFSSEQKMILR